MIEYSPFISHLPSNKRQLRTPRRRREQTEASQISPTRTAAGRVNLFSHRTWQCILRVFCQAIPNENLMLVLFHASLVLAKEDTPATVSALAPQHLANCLFKVNNKEAVAERRISKIL